jgi:hypothetical protein
MATYKLVPVSAPHSMTINGRTYKGTVGTPVDVPDFDAAILTAGNGWVSVAQSGTTAQRPAVPSVGQLFHDNTLGYVVVWEGGAWRNPANGASV